MTEFEIAQKMLEMFFRTREDGQDTIIWRNIEWMPTLTGQQQAKEVVYRLTFTKVSVASPEVPNYED